MSADAGLADSAELSLPSGVTVKVEHRSVVVHGPLGTVRRGFPSDALALSAEKGSLTLTLKVPSNRKRAKALLHTWEAHLRNLILGVTQGFEARMKVVAAHFPMKVQAKDGELLIENFLGEKYPRTARLVTGVRAEVSGEFVVLSGHDVEEVGQSAANIERATHIRDYDPRVFQDGIYIIEKPRPKEAAA